MDVSGEAVGAMQAYLRLKRYILPSDVAWESLQAAVPFLSQPSAARELALEEAARIADAYIGGEYEAQGCAAEQIACDIRSLSSPDHADAVHAQARDVLARFRDYVIEGITAGTIMRGGEHHNPIWQEVASVLHADAGKVEGNGFVAYRFKHRNDGPHMWEYYPLPLEERSTSPDFVTQALTLKKLLAILNSDQHADRQLPSAPASEGVE